MGVGGTGGSGGAGSTDTGGAGGSGGAGAGGAGGAGGSSLVCVPLSTAPCYTGPAGTEGVGACAAGSMECLPDGSGYAACTGEIRPGLEDCQSAADENCNGSGACVPGDVTWAQRYGDGSIQAGLDIAVDPLGDVVVVGHFKGTIDLGGGTLTSAGGSDFFVVKLDASGNHLWSKRFGSAGSEDNAASLAVSPAGEVVLFGNLAGTLDFGGGPLTSAGQTDLFVARLDAEGNHLWSQRFGDPDHQFAGDVAIDAAGAVVLTSAFRGSVDLGGGALVSSGEYDVLVAKLDPAGNHLWSHRYGDASHQRGLAVTTGAAGEVLFAGTMRGTMDLGGSLLQASSPNGDAFVVKLDAAGVHVWSQLLYPFSLEARAIALDAQENVLVTGTGSIFDMGQPSAPLPPGYGVEFFVAKLDPAGAPVWTQDSPAPWNQEPTDIAADGSGSVLVTGYFGTKIDLGGGTLPSFQMQDMFLGELDGAGAHVFSRSVSGPMDQAAQAMALDPSGGVWVTGRMESTVDFGGLTLTSAGESDVFIARFAR